MLEHLAQRAISGVEVVANGCYRRTLSCAGQAGTVEIAPAPGRAGLAVTLNIAGPHALPAVARQVEHLGGLDADIATMKVQLAAADPVLARLIAQRPGLRVPGGWDAFELAIRAVLGQQITLAAARQLAGKLVTACGTKLDIAQHGDPHLRYLFPTPAQLAQIDFSVLGMPRTRAKALSSLAAAVLADPSLLRPAQSLEISLARLRAVPGIGDWTAHYIALRALGEPDAFPASDVALLRAFQDNAGRRPTSRELLARAEAWRPWRAYAAQHLWTAGVGGALAPGDEDRT